MFSKRLLPLVLVVGALQAAPVGETWESATRRLQTHADASQGPGAVLLLERLDARTIRVRLKTSWPSFRGASFRGSGRRGARHQVWHLEGRTTDTLEHTATIDPNATRMEVRLHGADFNPKIMMRLPAPGHSEVGTVLVDQGRAS